VLDELGQPADLAVDGLEPVLVQRAGVAVQPFAGAGKRAAHAVALLLDAAAPAFEDLEPDVGARLGEERQPGAEPLVVEGIRTDLTQQLGQVFLALCGEPVNPLAAPGTRGSRRPPSGGTLRFPAETLRE